MLRIFYGPDTYSRAEAVSSLKRELDPDGMLSTNTVSLDGAHLDLASLIATCNTVPFLASQRLVIVNDLLSQGQQRAASLRSSRRRGAATEASPSDELVAYVPSMPPSTTLLLLDGALREENPVLGSLRPLGETRRFPLLNDQQLADWVEQRFAALDATAEPAAVQLLVRTVHADLWQMSEEVKKLALYATGRMVLAADTRALVAAARESNVFAMVDAIIENRTEAALQQLETLLQAGAVAPYLLTMIARQYRQLIVAEDLLKTSAAPHVIQKAAEIRSEAGVRRLIQQARRTKGATLKAQFERILEADLDIKRGRGDERVILQILVTDLTRLPTTRADLQPARVSSSGGSTDRAIG